MNKVITINLNGRGFQVEDAGYEKLQIYLQEAKDRLAQDPDKDEIISDLEQAVAEKFSRFLNAGKTVILEKEVDEAIKEMGPVQAGQPSDDSSSQKGPPKDPSAPKRLYLIRDGAMFRGVCTGLAAYFNTDVTLVRLIFVVVTILSHGLGIIVYLIMMIVVPKANTSQQKAQAHGQPFTAQEWIDRARSEYQNFKDKGEWKKWRYELKEKRREWKQERRRQRMGERGPMVHPLLGIFIAVLSLLWLFGLLSLATKGMVLGYAIPVGIPLWVAILVWLCLYSFIVWPIKAARWHYGYSNGENGQVYHYYQHGGFPEFIAWVAFWVIVVWALWHFVPVSRPYFEKIELWGQHVWERVRR